MLEAGFQHGDALTAAGLATFATNAVPIAAGFIVLGEHLPQGSRGILQLAAFALLVVSAVFLTHAASTTRIPISLTQLARSTLSPYLSTCLDP